MLSCHSTYNCTLCDQANLSDRNCRMSPCLEFLITPCVIECNFRNCRCRELIFGLLSIVHTLARSIGSMIIQLATWLDPTGTLRLVLSSLHIKFTYGSSPSSLSSSKCPNPYQNSLISIVLTFLSFLALAFINGPPVILGYSILALKLASLREDYVLMQRSARFVWIILCFFDLLYVPKWFKLKKTRWRL